MVVCLVFLLAPVRPSSAISAGSTGAALVDSQSILEEPQKASATSAAVSQRVQGLLARMTPREKVGQMTQLEIGMITDGKGRDLKVNPEKLKKAVADYGVGSLLNVNDEALSPAKWHEILRAIQEVASTTRLKIPVLYGIDTIHGANYVEGATLFPQPLAMAATWNPDLMRRSSRVAAAETRATGIPWTFSPVLDVGRQPLWSRLFETLGEDPYLATVMGVATVRGYQGDDVGAPASVAACLKHYVGYSFPWTGHDRTQALIPEITLREYFLPDFAAAVKAGAKTVMVNSGDVNGIPGHMNPVLLKDVLRGEMGFKGLVVSDWEDIKKLVTYHHAAPTEKDATRLAVLAGIDMSMVPSDYSFSDLLLQLVTEGAVPMARIDEAVARVLTLKVELGLFDEPLRGLSSKVDPGSAESRRLSLDAAREAITLLKNEGRILPLQAGARVLVTGPTADTLVSLNNGWTLTWQGDREAIYPKDRPTILGAIRARLGAGQVTYVPGATLDHEVDVAAAAAAARDADAAIVCLGEGAYCETPGNIDELTLPEAQLRLAEAVAGAGKPVILVLAEGRPRIIRRIASAARGIVMAYNPGLEGGQAVSDVLFGDVNPSGKLPITYPREPNALSPYDHRPYEEEGQEFPLKAQFPFGFGLSYTTFAYSGFEVEPRIVPPQGGEVHVSVTVKNTGDREGAEVVQLFSSQHAASVAPSVRRLKRFAKVLIAPGESRVVHFRLRREDFSFIGAKGKPTIEPGAFTLTSGGLKQDLRLQ